MSRILVAEAVAAEGIELLQQGAEVDVRIGLSAEDLLSEIAPYDGLVVRSRIRVTSQLIAEAERLAVIGRAGTGVDNIDVAEATRRGIVVVNVPYGNTVSVAEHTLGVLLAMVRNIPRADAALRKGHWSKTCCQGVQVRGKALGLIGLGRVGAAVAKRAQGLELRVVAFDPFVSVERAAQLGVELVTLADLLHVADFVSLHLPESDQTRGLIGSEELASMKPSAYLINCARGGLVDEIDLLEALDEGRIAGAALDVFSEEPLAVDHPLLRSDRVVLTPHLAGSTTEAQRDTAVEVAQQMLDVLAGRMPRHPVNAPALSSEELEQLGPYLDLAQRLGAFYAQLGSDRLEALEVASAGEMAKQRLDLVLSAALVGVLHHASEEPVNWINAQMVAHDRGIAVAAGRKPLSSTAGWANLIELRVRSNSKQHIVAGTVLRSEPHIVQIDGFWLDFPARGLLLVSEHIEQPGILGRMGTFLGKAGINIHFVQVGRQQRGGPGMLVMGLDDPLTAETQEDILALPSIRSVRMVRL